VVLSVYLMIFNKLLFIYDKEEEIRRVVR